MYKLYIISIFVFCLISAPSLADTLLVQQDGTGDHITIQAAIDASVDADTILIGPGTYSESLVVEKSLTFATDGPLKSVELDGLGFSRIMLVQGQYSVKLSGLVFTHGYAEQGSALFIWHQANVVVENCDFVENFATESNAVHVRNAGTNVTFSKCEFRNNVCNLHSAALSIGTGGKLLVENCIFAHNTSGGYGAVNANNAHMDIRDSLFLRNNGGSVGALACVRTTGEITGNTFHQNRGSVGTVAMNTSMLFANNIVSSERQGPGLSCSSLLEHHCNLFFDNNMGAIEGSSLASDELVADPQYCDYKSDELTLCAFSIALADNNGCGQMGAFGVGCQDCGTVPTEKESWGSVKAMYR